MGGMDGSGGGRSQASPANSSGNATLVNNNNLQTVFISVGTGIRRVYGSMDLAALVTAGSTMTVTASEKIDDTNYAIIDVTTFKKGTDVVNPKWDFMTACPCKVEMKMDVAESTNRNIPFKWIEIPQV